MKQILVTGFEPFGGAPVNQSWETVCLLPDSIGECRITKLRLPVVFGKAASVLLTCAEEIHPDAVFMLGEAGGRTAVTPESTAQNWMEARIPDNAGQQPTGDRIDPEGPERLYTTLPLKDMVLRMRKNGARIEVSDSAGTYVCNDTFYRVLHAFQGTGVIVDFVHVPAGTRENPVPSVSAAEAAAVLFGLIDMCFHEI